MPLRDANGPLEDQWIRVEAGAPLAHRSILALADAAARGADLSGIEPSRIGLDVDNDVEGASLVPWFGKAGLIAIRFPGFADGRGFSLARLLRRLGFEGRLRATGPVIADQFADLAACGFNEVETPEALAARQPEAQWTEAAASIGLGYQRGYGGRRNILDARRAGRGA